MPIDNGIQTGINNVMIVSRTRGQTEIEYDELATLKHIADIGAVDGYVQVSCADLADEFSISNQTASRRLQRLEKLDLIDRKSDQSGQTLVITPSGLDLLIDEYKSYLSLFGNINTITLEGTVTSGMGRGRGFVSLPGYADQFEEKLGYEPFPGTLNVSLTNASIRRRVYMNLLNAIPIDSWEDENSEYGAASCYSATIATDTDTASGHVIVPHKTDHGRNEIEILAPDELRQKLALSDGDEVVVEIK